MSTVFDALCRLLAPIMAFTTEEASGCFRPDESVHLQFFPQADPEWLNPLVVENFDLLLNLRGKIMQTVESAQKAKTIGGTLEARVVLRVCKSDDVQVTRKYRAELEEIFVISDLTLEEPVGLSAATEEDMPEVRVEVSKTSNARCERCWRHRNDVGSNQAYPTLCGRCAKVLFDSAVTTA